MVASANWVPSSLGGRGLVPLCCGDHDETNVGDEETLLLSKNALNHHHHNDDHHHQAVPPFAGDLLHIDVDDSDEEMEPFDAERFVDRLVEDDPSPWRCDGVGQGQAHLWEAPGADAGTGMMMTGPSSRSTSAAAKLFLQPIHSWPLAPQPQLPLPLPQPPLDAPARSVFEEGSRGVPFVVPHDPILDALFTPARATSPEIVPTVTYGLVGVGAAPHQQQQHEQQLGGGSSNIRNGGVVPRFEPAAIYNIPAPVDVFPAAVRVPTAPLPLKPSFGVGGNGRGGGGGFCLLASPSGAKIIFGSEEGFPRHQQQQQQQLIQQQQQQQEQELLQQQQLVQQQQLIQQEQQEQEQRQPFPFATINTVLQQQQQQKEIPGKVFGGADAFSTTTSTAVASVATISSATATIAAATRAAATSAVAIAGVSAPAPPQLTGADGFSDEYNDQQHAFLRRQEVALFVGPGYLAGPGRPGLVTPAERTSIVAWLCEVHAAAPAASCGEVVGGGGGGGSPPLSRESLFLAVNLLDRFLSTAEGARTSFAGVAALRVAAAASLALASKYEDTQAASLWGVAAASALANSTSCYCCSGGGESCDSFCSGGGGGGCVGGLGGGGVGGGGGDVRAARKELAAMELRVASALGFRLTVPTALSFLGVFMRRADALGYLASGAGSERVREEAQQILLCVLRDACSLEHPPSALAAAALYWASCVTAPGAAAPASFSFFAVTGYQLERLCHCLRDMEGVRTGGGRRHGGLSAGGGGVGGGGDWAGAAFPEHAERSLFDAGGGHPAIAAL